MVAVTPAALTGLTGARASSARLVPVRRMVRKRI
jgi:hypothetical protein